LARDGAYLLLSDQVQWTAEQLWSTYTQPNLRSLRTIRAIFGMFWAVNPRSRERQA
jgi:hypothetical protein